RSKEELFLAMLDERFSEQLRKLDETLSAEGELGDQVREAAADFAHDLADEPEWVRLYFQFAAHAARDESFRAELVTRERALRAHGRDHRPSHRAAAVPRAVPAGPGCAHGRRDDRRVRHAPAARPRGLPR